MQLSLARDAVENAKLRLAVTGDIDYSSAGDLRTAILATLEQHRPGQMVVDLGAVPFIDSTGIATLIAGRNAARGSGAAYSVVNPQADVRRVLKMTGVLDALAGG